MKLRSKRTGEIVELSDEEYDAYKTFAKLMGCDDIWEHYQSTEPLIKDEKIRKAVRAWAEACDIKSCYLECGEFCTKHREIDYCIGFGERVSEIPLEEKYYTIAELCGEEEE